MEDLIKYKQIFFSESVGKTIKDVYCQDDRLLLTYTDETFCFVESSDTYGLYKVDLDLGKVLDEVSYSYKGDIGDLYPLGKFFIESGIILKKDLDKIIKERERDKLEKQKARELEQYKQLKAKYEGSSD